ncbi:hypothetical protein SNEBB_007810 [Seison nebaliae]|nr:hypothetical protein SNEBB_007810 [Seison nebaliae]
MNHTDEHSNNLDGNRYNLIYQNSVLEHIHNLESWVNRRYDSIWLIVGALYLTIAIASIIINVLSILKIKNNVDKLDNYYMAAIFSRSIGIMYSFFFITPMVWYLLEKDTHNYFHGIPCTVLGIVHTFLTLAIDYYLALEYIFWAISVTFTMDAKSQLNIFLRRIIFVSFPLLLIYSIAPAFWSAHVFVPEINSCVYDVRDLAVVLLFRTIFQLSIHIVLYLFFLLILLSIVKNQQTIINMLQLQYDTILFNKDVNLLKRYSLQLNALNQSHTRTKSSDNSSFRFHRRKTFGKFFKESEVKLRETSEKQQLDVAPDKDQLMTYVERDNRLTEIEKDTDIINKEMTITKQTLYFMISQAALHILYLLLVHLSTLLTYWNNESLLDHLYNYQYMMVPLLLANIIYMIIIPLIFILINPDWINITIFHKGSKKMKKQVDEKTSLKHHLKTISLKAYEIFDLRISCWLFYTIKSPLSLQQFPERHIYIPLRKMSGQVNGSKSKHTPQKHLTEWSSKRNDRYYKKLRRWKFIDHEDRFLHNFSNRFHNHHPVTKLKKSVSDSYLAWHRLHTENGIRTITDDEPINENRVLWNFDTVRVNKAIGRADRPRCHNDLRIYCRNVENDLATTTYSDTECFSVTNNTIKNNMCRTFLFPQKKKFIRIMTDNLIDGHWDDLLNILRNKGKIMVMMGAGCSTESGIPDFRSPETGLYATLKDSQLSRPEDIFTLTYFRKNPKPFYDLAKNILFPIHFAIKKNQENLDITQNFVSQYRPSLSHYLVKLLQEKNKLGYCFTQNIDGLERYAGIDENRLIEAHGNMFTGKCIKCWKRYNLNEIIERSVASKDGIPRCNTDMSGMDKKKMMKLIAELNDNNNNNCGGDGDDNLITNQEEEEKTEISTEITEKEEENRTTEEPKIEIRTEKIEIPIEQIEKEEEKTTVEESKDDVPTFPPTAFNLFDDDDDDFVSLSELTNRIKNLKFEENQSQNARPGNCSGILKPDIVFFGEGLPEKFMKFSRKIFDGNALIIMGTSLEVYPFASLQNFDGYRLLLNMNLVGSFTSSSEKKDLMLLGKLKYGVTKLILDLGWEKEMRNLLIESNDKEILTTFDECCERMKKDYTKKLVQYSAYGQQQAKSLFARMKLSFQRLF